MEPVATEPVASTEDAKRREPDGGRYPQEPLVTENHRFESFYNAQMQFSDEDAAAFLTCLRKSLPACFRINSDCSIINELKEELQAFCGTTITTDDNTIIEPVKNMRWYSNAYQMGTDKRMISKESKLEFFKKWLNQHSDSGNITRQEAVSMIPPLALNVSPHHKCLDLCAAPGSKTSQMLEIIHKSIDSPIEQQGVVLANDADTQRAYMLVSNCRRINSPLLVVTTHKGQIMPNAFNEPSGFFDRVLADVPCSGDGTMRKNPQIWGKWDTSSSISLHPLQLSIAQKGLKLLKDEGLMVYSTCSFCPYENEAVVAELLRQNQGKLEIVDAREFLPNFKARPGLSHWYVLDDKSAKQAEIEERKAKKRRGDDSVVETTRTGNHGTHADPRVQACLDAGMDLYQSHSETPEVRQRVIRKTIFPPTAEEASWMNLHKCLRCVPQDEDTGGFFVCTLRKINSVAPKASERERGDERKAENNASNVVEYSVWEEEGFRKVKEMYGIDDRISCRNMYTRTDNQVKSSGSTTPRFIYVVPDVVHDLFTRDKEKLLKFVVAGVKCFERKALRDDSLEYRLLQDGAGILLPYITKRKIALACDEFCKFIDNPLVPLASLTPSTVAALDQLSPGVVVFTFCTESSGIPNRRNMLHIVCTKGSTSPNVNVCVNKTDMTDIKNRLIALKLYTPPEATAAH